MQVDNTGDLLINKSELDLLRKYGEVIIDDSNTPSWFVDSIADYKFDKKLSDISDLPLLDAIGHELKSFERKSGKVYLFIQPGHTSRKGFRNAYNNLKKDSKFWKLKIGGCRICRVGFSIGPFDTYYGIKESLGSLYYSYYAVRDSTSLKLAKSFGFYKPDYFPDLAFAFKVDAAANKKAQIVLSFRSNEYGSDHDPAYLKPIVERLKLLLKIKQFDFCKIIVTYQVKFDAEPAREIYSELKENFDAELIDHQLTLDEASKLYAESTCVLSNRLHVILLALQSNTLAIPLVNYQGNSKITGILEDNGLRDIILNRELSIESNLQTLEKAVNNSSEILLLYQKQSERNYESIVKKLDTLFRN